MITLWICLTLSLLGGVKRGLLIAMALALVRSPFLFLYLACLEENDAIYEMWQRQGERVLFKTQEGKTEAIRPRNRWDSV